MAETAEVLSAMFSGLYGSCLMPDDEQLVLQLLHDLMRLQLTSAANPRDDFGLEGSFRKNSMSKKSLPIFCSKLYT